MTEHDRRFFDAVPLENVASADAACHDPDKELPRPYLGFGAFFQADIVIIVVDGNSHSFPFPNPISRFLMFWPHDKIAVLT
jgi:hypothetical protein